MKLGYVIVYVADVSATLDFYERAFGLERRFLHESGAYGEMETGATALSFVAETLIEMNDIVARPNRLGDTPPGVEVGLVTDDVVGAYRKALDAGALACVAPMVKPWGQTVAYVRDNNGFLVELCTPMNA